jgi:mannose-6-phosphate isomerase
LNKKQINTNDIINVPAGTIHALTTGLFVLEIQEPIDLTYRLYDYGRNNKNRKLDVKKVIDSSNIPFVNNYPNEQKNELHTPQFDMHIIHNKRYKNYNFPQAK